MSNNDIEHIGEIVVINNEEIIVRIVSESSCASCHARGACGTLDSKEKDIIIKTTKYKDYNLGQIVTICIEQKVGFKAVFFGFLMPFLVLLFFVIISSVLFNNDAISALMGLLSVALYYGCLYFFRNNLEKKFIFKIK